MNITIIGGGIIGMATAYFLGREGVSVEVIERDTNYTNASFARSCGGFRHQFLTRENILLGKFGQEFIQSLDMDVQWVPNGYLLLFNEEQANQQNQAVAEQWDCDVPSKTLEGTELQKIFPWLNTDGVALGTYTDSQVEGWLDPHSLHSVFKQKAIELGVKLVKAEIESLDTLWTYSSPDAVVVTAGCWTQELLADIPIVPQKHTVFNIKCPIHIPEMPLVGDFTTKIYWRPEGEGYIVGSPVGRFDQADLEPDLTDFEEYVWEPLAHRVSLFEEVKVTGGWAGYYDTNTLDNNAIVGKYPQGNNTYVASGFTGRGVMQAPGIGRALMELILTGEYQSIDLSRLSPDRLFTKDKQVEPYVL